MKLNIASAVSLWLGVTHVAASQISTCSSYANISTTYPNKVQICSVFSQLTGDSPDFIGFFSHVSDNVNWTIEGTHPLAGQYNNKTVLEAAFARIAGTTTQGIPLKVSLINIIGGCNEAWSVQELHITGKCVSGLVFDNRYAWVTKWNTAGIIVKARAYLDSALVAAAIISSEIGPWHYSDQRTMLTPYVTLSPEQLAGASGLQTETA